MRFSKQQPPEFAPVPLQLPAASNEAWNNCGPLQCMPPFSDKKNPYFVQPNANPILPKETLSSYTGNLYQSPAIPMTSPHEEQPYIQSSKYSNVCRTSSRNGSAGGGSYEETTIASGTAASQQLKKFPQLSLKTKGNGKGCMQEGKAKSVVLSVKSTRRKSDGTKRKH